MGRKAEWRKRPTSGAWRQRRGGLTAGGEERVRDGSSGYDRNERNLVMYVVEHISGRPVSRKLANTINSNKNYTD